MATVTKPLQGKFRTYLQPRFIIILTLKSSANFVLCKLGSLVCVSSPASNEPDETNLVCYFPIKITSKKWKEGEVENRGGGQAIIRL